MLIYLIKTCLLKLLQKIKNAEHKTSLYQYSTFNQITNSFLIIIDNWEQVDARVISTNWPGALISKTSVYSKYVLIHKLCDNFTCFSDVSVKEIASQPAAQQQIDDVPGSSRSSWKSKLRKSFRKKKGTQKSAGKKKETNKNEIGSRSTLKWTTTHSCVSLEGQESCKLYPFLKYTWFGGWGHTFVHRCLFASNDSRGSWLVTNSSFTQGIFEKLFLILR